MSLLVANQAVRRVGRLSVTGRDCGAVGMHGGKSAASEFEAPNGVIVAAPLRKDAGAVALLFPNIVP